MNFDEFYSKLALSVMVIMGKGLKRLTEGEIMEFKLYIGEEEDIFTKKQILRNRKKRLEILKEWNRQKEKECEEEIQKLESVIYDD